MKAWKPELLNLDKYRGRTRTRQDGHVCDGIMALESRFCFLTITITQACSLSASLCLYLLYVDFNVTINRPLSCPMCITLRTGLKTSSVICPFLALTVPTSSYGQAIYTRWQRSYLGLDTCLLIMMHNSVWRNPLLAHITWEMDALQKCLKFLESMSSMRVFITVIRSLNLTFLIGMPFVFEFCGL